MAAQSASLSPSNSMSRPRSPSQDSPRRPPPLTTTPPKSPLSSSPEIISDIDFESQPESKSAGDYLLPGVEFETPQKVSNSPLPSNVPTDSSSVATLDSQVSQQELNQEVMPSAALEARVSLEQTAAAAKYGVHTKSASDGADVRWYFCKNPLRPNQAAAQVPTSEVVGKGDYFRFSVRDSLALEAAFVQREEEFVSAWWKEYAEVSEGPVISSSHRALDTQEEQKEVTEEDQRSLNRTCDGDKGQMSFDGNNPDVDDGESVGVLVKGGLYEVDLMRRICIPVYWRGEHRRVLRGHWYVRKGGLDWLPLREDVAEQLEIAYHSKIWRRRAFQPSGLYAARVNLTGTFLGLHALFTGEDDTWEAVLAVDASGISAVLGLKGSGVKLRRGFAPPDSVHPTQDELRQRKEEELDDYASQVPVRHVVFMVHGIGQRLEKANLVDDVGTFRRTVSALAEHHLTPHQRNAQRILFIPCQWRRELKLGGEVAMENITLEGVRALRTMITATVHDVLYYMSPVYCQDIIDSVTRSLNRLYIKFIKRNPSFDGKVSLYGHSLGSVLTYDILCHQDTLTSAFPVQNINASMMRNSDSEDDMPKIDRLPSTIENDLTSEEDAPVHNSDMLIPEDSVLDFGQTTLAFTTSNNSIPDIVKDTVEEDCHVEVEAMDADPDATEDNQTAVKDQETLEDESADRGEIETADKYRETVEDVENAETSEKIAQEIKYSGKGEEVPQEAEIGDKIKEVLEEEVEIENKGKEMSDEVEIADKGEEMSEEVKLVDNGEEIPREVEINEKDEEHGREVGSVKEEMENSEREIKSTEEQKRLEETKGSEGENEISHVVETTEPEFSQDFAVAEMEKTLNILDRVIEDFGSDVKELSEVDMLNAKVAALQEKLRLLEGNQMTNMTSQSLPEDVVETLPKTKAIDISPPLELQSTGENARSHECVGDGMQQSTSENEGWSKKGSEFGSVRGNMDASVSSRKQHRPFIIYPKLKFQVDTFYAVGSPLGMFLALRNIRIGLGTGKEYWQDEGIDEEMPACRLLLNIFHPYDPVAYRLEPLVCKEYVDRRPVFIPYHKGGKRLHIGLQEFGEDISTKSKAFMSSIGAVGTRVAHVFVAKKDGDLTDEEEERNRKKPVTYGQTVMERLTGSSDGRVDCMLQDSTFEHQYISAISSHTGYWEDPDTALFILKHLYRDIPEEEESKHVTTMEPLHGMIDDDEILKPVSPPSLPPLISINDSWDSDDEDLNSSFFDKADFVAALSSKEEDIGTKPTGN